MAKTRTEQAEIRTEQAETRTEMAELRTEQIEKTLQRVVNKEVHLSPENSAGLLEKIPLPAIVDRNSWLEQLTIRQREVLQFIADGQNTKQVADLLKLSPKTVEYHRLKLMNCLNIHDVPGLVRFAMRVGLIPQESSIALPRPGLAVSIHYHNSWPCSLKPRSILPHATLSWIDLSRLPPALSGCAQTICFR